jgi:hypothetical protein
MSTESFVQLAPDGTGKQIDAITVIPAGATTPNYRQTITLGDDNFASNTQEVGSEGDALVKSFTLEDLITQMLVEMRITNHILSTTLGSRDDIEALRAEISSYPLQTSQ